LNEQALSGFAGLYRWPLLTAFERSGCRIESQAALLLVSAVTFHAGRREDGFDVAKIIDRWRC
jgi:hypothetical protein